MTADSVRLTATQQTMLLTLNAHAVDNRSPDPILGDGWAEQTLARISAGPDLPMVRRDDAAGILCRARQLDEWTISYLSDHPNAVVLHLGCGLDSRVLRVDPPSTARWYDVDFPEVIDLRRRVFGADERDGYRMIGSSVTDPEWLDSIPTDRPVMVTAEGLLMYLVEGDVRQLICRIAEHRSGRLACDVELPWAARLAKYNPVLRKTGAIHRWGIKNLDDLTEWVPGMRLMTAHSVTALPGIAKVHNASRRYRWINQIPALRDAMRVALYEF
jgi:O-methyltransferase involved in polyketide biosynthesis